MAVRQEALPGLTKRATENTITMHRASWGQLARVELPLTALLAFFFTITLFVTPSLEIDLLGIELPTLVLCPMLALTGIPCLMCGITRSFLAMGGLDLSGSFLFHPLGPVFFLALVLLFITGVLSLATRRQLRVHLDAKLKQSLLRVGIVIILAAWPVKVVIWSQVGLL